MRIPVLILLLSALASAQPRPEWDNPSIIHVGTTKPHATMMAFPSADLGTNSAP